MNIENGNINQNNESIPPVLSQETEVEKLDKIEGAQISKESQEIFDRCFRLPESYFGDDYKTYKYIIALEELSSDISKKLEILGVTKSKPRTGV